MEEESKTIINDGDLVNTEEINNPDESQLELMEAAVESMKKDLREIGAGLDETLAEAKAAAAKIEDERKTETVIDRFAKEVAERQVE